ncbi:MAG: hypothetical protein O2818_06205 [Bacteroidetes bacterium]|nr:hypothetical protein [Bacteroidota bacterium]
MKYLIYTSLSIFLLACSGGESSTEATNTSATAKTSGTTESFGDGSGASAESATGAASYTPDFELAIKLTPFVPDYPSLGASGKQMLESRLNTAIAKVAYGGAGQSNPKFIIGPSVTLLSENVTATAPPKYMNTYEVNLLAVDAENEMVMASYAFEVKGVGDSPTKSFINAFREVRFDDEGFFQFLRDAEEKAIGYYTTNCAAILSEAEAEAALRNYDAAYALVSVIPMEAAECFASVKEAKIRFFNASLTENCNELLSKMQAELGKMNDPSASGFNPEAMSYYAMIDRASTCYPEAQKIYNEYTAKLDPKAKVAWEREEREFELKVSQIEANQELRRDSVMANFEYLKNKDNMKAKADIEGNRKLLNKYKYDQLPWIRRVFHLGEHDPFDGSE